MLKSYNGILFSNENEQSQLHAIMRMTTLNVEQKSQMQRSHIKWFRVYQVQKKANQNYDKIKEKNNMIISINAEKPCDKV